MTNENVLKGRWKKLSGKAREQWSKLASEELDDIQEKTARLDGLLMKRYGYARKEGREEMRRKNRHR